MSSWIIRGERVGLPDGIRPATIRIDNGRITSISPGNPKEGVASTTADRIIDAGTAIVMPGLVDTHVHINDPGRTDWEGFETATRAAAAGGVTTLVDMPLNSVPPTTTLAGLEAKVRALETKAHVDVALCGGLVPENPKGLAELFAEGVLSFKCFLAESGVGEFSHVDEATLREGMDALAKINAPLFVHAELPAPLSEGEKAA